MKHFQRYGALLEKIASAVRDAVGATGVNIHSNHGADAEQAVFHTHFHIIPRAKGDGLKSWLAKEYSKEELKNTAENIRS